MDIYFDESGFTGRALLDPLQPYFSVASTNLGPEVATDIMRTAFPAFRGREVKFQALWRRAGNRPGFIRLAELLDAHSENLFAWQVDKRFCVLQKLIDFLIEPLIHEAGFDFYADAHAPKFSNYVHDAINFRGSEALYVATTDAYFRFARAPSEATLTILQDTLWRMTNSVSADLRWFYDLAHTGAVRFHRYHQMGDFSDTTEIQLSCVLASVAHWRALTRDTLRILHDDSRNFFAQEEMWATITADDVPPHLQHGGNGPPMEFPLRISETLAANSEDHSPIQLCDLLAGLVNKAKNPRDGEQGLVNELIEAGLGEITLNGLRPYADYPDGPPRRLDGPDIVDQLLAVMYPHLPPPPA